MSTTTSPFRPRPPKPSPSSPFTTSSTTTPPLRPSFTPEMRDRQARGKDPYRSDSDPHSSDDDDDDDDGRRPSSKMRLGGGGGGARNVEKLDFSRVELRQRAIAFLENPELLMMWAQSKGDSVASARLHFTRMLCGYEKPEGSKSKATGGGAGGRRSLGQGGQGQEQAGQGGGGGSGSGSGGGKGKGKEEKRR